MIKIVKSVLFAALFSVLLFGKAAQAQTTINAATCNSSDVQAALNKVAADGTTVNIPAGTCTWTTTVSYNQVFSTTILGAGNQSVVGGGDATVIIDNVSHSPNDNPTLNLTAAPGKSLRLSGITMKSNGSSSQSFNGSITFYGTSNAVRIDHAHLQLTADGKQMTIGGCVYGVMDHSIVDLNAGTTQNGVFLHQGNCGGDSLGVGDGQWHLPTSLGSANFFYFENDIFNGGTNLGGNGSTVAPFVDDCSGGGRFVFRFNSINGAQAQGHATGHSNNPPDRSCRAYEIYMNTFGNSSVTNTSNPVEDAFYNTGGTGVVWGNTFTGYYKNIVETNVDRTNSNTYVQAASPTGWGYCNGSSNWDGNQPGQNGWPCLDQIGRGEGDLLQGVFPTVCDASLTDCQNHIFSGRWPNQALEPVYQWMDKFQPAPSWGGLVWVSSTNVVPNRDYYLYTLAWNGSSFTGTAFNGTVGTGSGTLASRPSTCTAGVAYWATDQGSWNQSGTGGQGLLYKCSSANTWTAYYTPYTYPHPLIKGSGSANNVAAPTSLTANVN
jgi:hypothetical protein